MKNIPRKSCGGKIWVKSYKVRQRLKDSWVHTGILNSVEWYVTKDQVHVLFIAASRQLKMMNLTKSIKECKKSQDSVNYLESDLQMLLPYLLRKPINKNQFVEVYTIWKILGRFNKIKSKYFMLEGERFISITLLTSMSRSWEKNFCRIIMITSFCYWNALKLLWVLTLYPSGYS